MIHFFISAQSEVGGRSLEHTLFEVGVRLGSPFIIHKNRSHIPCDASVVSIGKLGQAALGWRLLELPDALDSGCEQVCADGLDLWARREDEGIDVISGCAELIGFRHEKSVAPRDFDAFGRIPSSKHPLVQAGVATRPLIENNVKYIENRLAEIGHRYERIYPWGKSGKYVACLSHDVDGSQLQTLFALSRSLTYALRGDRYEREFLELGVIN